MGATLHKYATVQLKKVKSKMVFGFFPKRKFLNCFQRFMSQPPFLAVVSAVRLLRNMH